MDWIIIIIFALGLPVIGGLVGVYLVSSKYYYIKNNPQEFGLEGEQEFRKNFGKYIVFQQMLFTASVYGLLILILFWSYSRDLDTTSGNLSKLGVTCAMAIGVPGLFCNISRGLIMREGFASVVRDSTNFGRAIVQVTTVETSLIYGLLIAILSFSFSGLFRGEFNLSCNQTDEMLFAVIIFSALSAGILLSGILINKVEDPFSPLNFAKGFQMNLVGAIPPIIGLAYVIIKFNEIGLFIGA